MQSAKPAVIGLAGYAGAGKDVFAGLLREAFSAQGKTASVVSSGDLIRAYVAEKKLGDPGDRALLRKTVDQVATEHGYTFWLERALAESASRDILLYPGLRQEVEVDFLHRRGDILIGIEVPIKVRYARSQSRNRPGDNISFETFAANEEAERAGTAQQIDAVMAKLDVIIRNDGTLEQLGAVAATIARDYPDGLPKQYKATDF